MNVVRDVMVAGAVDDGTGTMVSWDALPPERKAAVIQVSVDEETFERNQRQREHILQGVRVREGGARLPVALVEAARAVLGHIDVDPASSAETNLTVGAGVWFAPADGLTHEWPGRVFLHPARDQAQALVERLLEQYRAGITTAAMVVVGTWSVGSDWFQPLFDFLACVVGRTREADRQSDSHVISYLGDDEARFIEAFRRFGPVLKRVDQSTGNQFL